MKGFQIKTTIVKANVLGVFMIVLGACANQPKDSLPNLERYASGGQALESNTTVKRSYVNNEQPVIQNTRRGGSSIITEGTGVFLNTNQIPPADVNLKNDPATISLNFESADLREVITTIFEALGYTYIIDPSVAGFVTINMPEDQPLRRSQLLPTLEKLLSMNGAALLKEGNLYRIVPIAAATAGNTKIYSGSNPVMEGNGTRIYPLKYISATEMVTILTPFVPQGSLLQADTVRNMITISGSPADLEALQSTINTFDVNWLKGMSIGVFSLDTMDAETAATQLSALLGGGGEGGGQSPMAGMLRFVPLTTINTLMVISPQKDYLREVEAWIRKIDNSSGERLYVYNVENGDAGYLAEVLGQIFSSGMSSSSVGSDTAPGLGSSNLTSGLMETSGEASFSLNDSGSTSSFGSDSQASPSTQSLSGSGSGFGMFGGRNVRVVADVSNNAILIWASPRDYDKVIAAIRRIDKTPRQVLIEATFAEVSLVGNLEYGLSWFFKNDVGSNQGAGVVGNGSGIGANMASLAGSAQSVANGGIVYGVANAAGDITAMLNALASDGVLSILSSPQVLAQDNQEATIKVGGEVPVMSNSYQSISSSDNINNSYEYKDTGVMLHVLPKVNSSGLVSLDIEQEITEVDQSTNVSSVGNPSFLTRSLQSKVSVQDGQTVILGGLISETSSSNKEGIPGLYKIPVLGSLFGSTSKTTDRKELMIMITPHVIQNAAEAREATEEVRARMSAIQPFLRKNKR